MTKSETLKALVQMKTESDSKPADELELMPFRILEALLNYINDPHIRAAVDEINF